MKLELEKDIQKKLKNLTISDKATILAYRTAMKDVIGCWIKNIQSSNTVVPFILDSFPIDCRGKIAKRFWNNEMFRYGAEYGMLALLTYFFNLTREELK